MCIRDSYIGYLLQQKQIEPALARPSRLPGALLRSPLVLRHGSGTLGAFLDTCTRDPALRTVLAAESGDYAEPPSRASLALHAGLMLHYLDEGGFYPEGGGQVMSDRLAEAIERHGGKLLLSSRVSRILVENGRVTGVRLANKRLGEREVRAPRVVAGSDIKKIYLDLLGPDVVRAKTMRKVKAWQMAPALGMVYLGVKREALGTRTRNTNYWIYGSTDLEGAYADNHAGRISHDPMVYISIASLKDCLLYTSDAADERSSVDLGGRRIIKKKKKSSKKKKKKNTTEKKQKKRYHCIASQVRVTRNSASKKLERDKEKE